MSQFRRAAMLLALATTSHAQYGGFGGNNGGGNPYGNGGDPYGGGDGPFGFPGFDGDRFFARQHVLIVAHAVLACIAFAFLFPVGGIMIRLASFPSLWLVHGLFQIFAYLVYTAAFAIGIYMAVNLNVVDTAHAIIGIVLFVLLFFQPISGFLHHTGFKRLRRRSGTSYVHIWLGRIIITLGIINGGLGLQLAQRLPFGQPPMGAIIGYSVVAGIIWLIYVFAIFAGESRRRQVAAETGRSRSSSSRSRSRRRGGQIKLMKVYR